MEDETYTLEEIKQAVIKTCRTEGSVEIHQLYNRDEGEYWLEDWEVLVKNLEGGRDER